MDGSPQLGGRAAIVTGGSRGIGFAIAEALVARGDHVAICGRAQTALDTARERLQERADGSTVRVLAMTADVCDARAVRRFVDGVVGELGGLDVLVNNAGIGGFAEVADQSPEAWSRTLETNLSGVFHCCHAAIPHLRRRGAGWIVNISSLASKNPFAGGAAYCASKAGLNAFSEALMQELRYDDIRVSYVLPGSVQTDFSGPDGSRGAGWKLAAQDVARAVVDLLSHDRRSLPSRLEIRPAKPGR